MANLYNKQHGYNHQHMMMGMMSGITGIGGITQADEQYNYSIPSEQVYSSTNLPHMHK